MEKLLEYLKGVGKEATLITWPERGQAMFQFGLVVIVSLFLIVLLYAIDIGISQLINIVNGTLGN